MNNTIYNILNRISSTLDCFTEQTGKIASWLVLFLVIIVSYDVTMRYIFQSGSIAIQELEWHVFSLIFLLGAAYTLKHDDHVRLDLLYQSRFMNDYRRAWVNFLGCLFFLIPFCILVIVSSWQFIHLSYIHNEGSPDPGGLSYRWIIKSAIPLSFILLLLQGISYSIKSLTYILDNKS
ncbi:MAG: TRAP transporter small permease subunit [Gammaproteobacteria bacterium]|jgi:TRAP-type mannitol/chloroaromatic compound transport system permease small subunit